MEARREDSKAVRGPRVQLFRTNCRTLSRRFSGTGKEVLEIDKFTTAQELPFPGHPTASWLHVHSKVSSEEKLTAITTKAGDTPMSPADPNMVSAPIPHNVHIRASRLPW